MSTVSNLLVVGWNLLILHKKKVLAAGAIVALAVSSPALAKWSDRAVLPALAENNIFGLTEDLVGRTGEMVDDTQQLEGQVARAESAMGGLDRQNELLHNQLSTNASIQKELDGQLKGNVEARELMEAILTREKKTAGLTKQASAKGDAVTGQMIETVSNLGTVADYTGKLGGSTARLNGRVDLLLTELDRSVENFRYVGKVTFALRYLENKLGLKYEDPVNGPADDVKAGTKEAADTVTDTLKGKKNDGDKEDSKGESGGGLGDLLPGF